MNFTELTTLLPCHSLDDFPVYHEGPRADELLAAWCAPWHPALLAAAQAVPNWHRVDMPPETLSGRLIVMPAFCHDQLPAGFAARAKDEGGWLVRTQNRAQSVAAALQGLQTGSDAPVVEIDAELAADFLALGFCRLQVELLTRQMRYTPNIDETHFRQQAVAAANAAVVHDTATARDHLSQCFDTLYEARKHFYPVDVFLLDITLLADTTLGQPLHQELLNPVPKNLLGGANLWDQLTREDPEAWKSLLAGLDAGTVCLLGNEAEESELPLLPSETALARLKGGAAIFERLLGRGPQVFARRRFGLWPTLPQMLSKLGYQGALHFTLDDGRFPLSPQAKTRWEGLDASVVDIFGRVPQDAAKPESLLTYSRTMADSMDNDHVATLAFAHWPGQVSAWYDDLRRVARLSPVLGKFMRLDDYFCHTEMPGRISRFECDEYRTPYLKQAIIRRQPDAISRCVRDHQAQAAKSSRQAIATLDALIENKSASNGQTGASASANDEEPATSFSLRQLAAALPRNATGTTANRYFVVNTLSFTRRIGIELAANEYPPAVSPPIVVAGVDGARRFAAVEVPAMGFAWFEPGNAPPAASRAKPIAQENTLRNEFFELTVSRGTGGIGSIFNFTQRGNQFSQQIAQRTPGAPPTPGGVWRDPDEDATYTTMRADSVEISANCGAHGEITTKGSLFDAADRRVATFRQTVRVWAGSRVIQVDVDLADLEEPRADPWNSYLAARFAWPDEKAELWRGVALTRQPTKATRFEAPEYVDVETRAGCISILTGGLPYHRRAGLRMLDTLLVVRGETARNFSFGIGVNLPQTSAAALEFITPPTHLFDRGLPPAASTGWLFHLDAKNVVATHWEALVKNAPGEHAGAESPPTVQGFRARLVETAGRGGRVGLRAFRRIATARQVDFLGQTMLQVPVEDDKIMLDFAAHEWIEIEAIWADR